MAAAYNFPDKCVVCQEEYDKTLPRDQLDVLRPGNCPVHFVHKDCLLPWVNSQQNCPVCLKPCTEIVDFNGESFESSATQESDQPQGQQPLLAQRLQQLARTVLSQPAGHPNALELTIMQGLLCKYTTLSDRQPNCQFCGRCCSGHRHAVTWPCGHIFHEGCLYHRLQSNRGLCPFTECGKQVAIAADPIFSIELYHYNRQLLGFLLLDSADQVSQPPSHTVPTAHVCGLCGENATDEERVITPCCHIFHSRCFDERAGSGIDTVRKCPLQNCGRPCLTVTRIPPQLKEDTIVTREPSSMTSPFRESPKASVTCKLCKQPVPANEIAKPNTCEHKFHRKCLFLKAKAKKQCPIRNCRRKFRIIEE